MFKKLLFSVLFLFLLVSAANAKIWRVNNNSNVNADFTTLQLAHDGATSGDTLHVEGSPTSYGGMTCTKKLIIIGPGYLLGQNVNTQALKQTAQVGAISFNTGSAGSVIMGMDFNGSGINVFSNDILIRRNKFSQTSSTTYDWVSGSVGIYYINGNGNTPANNIIISQNYGVRVAVNYASNGILITNNYMLFGAAYGDNTTSDALYIQANGVGLVQNNVFRNGRITANNSNFTNNIMVVGSIEGTGNLISNNLSNGTQFGSANGNLANQDMSTVFIGSGTDISPDGQWKLKVGSPAIGAGYGSTAGNPIDAGMYSGHSPYVLAGLPPVPAVYFFENQPVGSNSDPINVTIKVKSVN